MSTTPELTTDQVAEYLEATCALIDSELTALGDDSSWHFDPKEWCANQVVGHLVEAEKRGFAGRIREILAGKEKTSSWDQAEVAKQRNDCAPRSRSSATTARGWARASGWSSWACATTASPSCGR